ncbi:hypothetical protein, partial [Undibacterium sp. CY21W]|uniref:hypothetical protein n=1 Tax=Undibacterium sp. CY21W TaxID=2762293 RepID=UPI001C9BAA20
ERQLLAIAYGRKRIVFMPYEQPTSLHRLFHLLYRRKKTTTYRPSSIQRSAQLWMQSASQRGAFKKFSHIYHQYVTKQIPLSDSAFLSRFLHLN